MASAYIAHLGDLSALFSFVGWWFLPGYVSSAVLAIFYRIFPSRRPTLPESHRTAADEKPIYNPIHELQKTEYDRRARHHHSIAHGLVIGLYLGYTLIVDYQKQTGQNHYSVLGIQSNSLAFNATTQSVPEDLNTVRLQIIRGDLLDESGLKSHWRRVARSFHPDKLSPPAGVRSEDEIAAWKAKVESQFIRMREAYETLNDNTKRWAYDRFGPTILQWKNCITLREYLIEGIKNTCPFYGFSFSSLLLIGTLRKTDAGTFWRWTIMMLVVGFEAIILTSTSLTRISYYMSLIFPNRAPFEHIELLRQFFIAGSCVATQISGIIYSVPEEKNRSRSLEQSIEPMLGLVDQVQEYSALANVELVKLLFNDLHPIIRNSAAKNKSNDKEAEDTFNPEADALSQSQAAEVQKLIADVKSKMLDTFCDLKFQSDPNGQAAWIQAIRSEDATE
ncbi:hypothetical protein PTTG_00961 [Puccinia triticina 1-1 BBBD Race 1]|uniref:J domain-containing protein n=2 Tax=Puccinia triticina TaxID=208348 RepID=A0A180GWZ9_PUCT1|nr:uncharacterized protein PtA15_3A709 [Puccinia triticina]OAV96503.1 hypothetical protein PTTG_00961 [Puccinia triticina 1-1 BBBD Race 1]WAQ83339.1 hypothetical protein PtA15_3A709 [Puccinia triticina]WAR54187.1 hypothetical protein PtB15_3B700 [Puccinia triticina]